MFAALAALFDNYEASPSQVEDHTQQEHEEELHLIEEMMKTDVMRTTLQFLVDRGWRTFYAIVIRDRAEYTFKQFYFENNSEFHKISHYVHFTGERRGFEVLGQIGSTFKGIFCGELNN